ncbi:MAG: hypoxanthine phosphoribosyltransferase [Candidatus Hepatoplasma vulgare]|nr:MAG: hypoxanthine phosphoribosyltransferase [Candidatus Hepatoplasma sp.]
MKKLKTRQLKGKNEIKIKLRKLAYQINRDFKNEKELLFIVVMKGGMFFASDLLKLIKIDLEIDFIFSKSYEKESKIGKPIINYLNTIDPNNKQVIIIDDLIDTGETLTNIINLIKEKNPKGISVATIFGNEKWSQPEIKKYYLFKTKKDYFVIGYGLDYEEKLRNLSHISIVK